MNSPQSKTDLNTFSTVFKIEVVSPFIHKSRKEKSSRFKGFRLLQNKI